MNTREIAGEYRLSHWAGIMRERKESGQSIRAYCRQTGMHENVYYYWQKKLREATCEELTTARCPEDQRGLRVSGFAEVRLAEANAARSLEEAGELRIEISGIRIAAGSGYPPEALARMLRELMRPC